MRRYPDFRLPLSHWSLGDAAIAGIGFLVGLLLIIASLSLVASQLPLKLG